MIIPLAQISTLYINQHYFAVICLEDNLRRHEHFSPTVFIQSPEPDVVVFGAESEISDLNTSVVAFLLKQDVF